MPMSTARINALWLLRELGITVAEPYRGRPDSLTDEKRREVLAYVACGFSDRQIAARFCVAPSTVTRIRTRAGIFLKRTLRLRVLRKLPRGTSNIDSQTSEATPC